MGARVEPRFLLSWLLVLWPAGVRGDGPTAPELDPAVGDPLELARLVDRHGDDVVARALAAPGRALRLVAVRAAPFTRRPGPLLSPLGELAGSRDPELAPEAARAVRVIAERLQLEGLEAEDLLPEDLAPARATLAKALARSALRADIRHAVLAADYALAESGVPPPAAP